MKLPNMTVNEDGTLNVPNETYAAIAEAAKKKYNFRGTSAKTIKKYVTKFIEEALEEYCVQVPNEFLPKKKDSFNE